MKRRCSVLQRLRSRAFFCFKESMQAESSSVARYTIRTLYSEPSITLEVPPLAAPFCGGLDGTKSRDFVPRVRLASIFEFSI